MTTLTKAQADLWIDYYDATKGKHPMPTDHASAEGLQIGPPASDVDHVQVP